MTPTNADIERQIRHEMSCVDEVVKRYRASLSTVTDRGNVRHATLAETGPGSHIISALMPRLTAAVASSQAFAASRIAEGGRGRAARRSSASSTPWSPS
ncbi:hypothetical protein [Oceanibacterium hippocampi]|uniref:Uncharacterized protein n=1 Tax=Oceanibacterium hippocampi TaxID=745714 RepID=A0A1Y5TZ51_9PROT|nr:hypothetical protein [Oceanibacterium hippocampi]SLN76394.1 hypothetical protein OCH7691_04118 [Oceanibacterium hippocampi]